MEFTTSDVIRVGQPARLRFRRQRGDKAGVYRFQFPDLYNEVNPFQPPVDQPLVTTDFDFEPVVVFSRIGRKRLTVTPQVDDTFPESQEIVFELDVREALTPEVPDQTVALVSPAPPASPDAVLWGFINQMSDRLRFDEFREFVEPRLTGATGPNWYGTDAYRELRRLAERFVAGAADPPTGPELPQGLVAAGLSRSYVSSEGADLARPFLLDPTDPDARAAKARKTPPELDSEGGRARRFTALDFPLPNVPFVELIWNYWIEEGMLVQTLNHILARFQNRRVGTGHDPLARFDLNPLLPLRNLLWGFSEDERRRLTVRRRAAEYEYQYGLRLLGRAVPPPSTLVERRTQFLEAFHALLHASHTFFKERDDKTVDADPFPLLSSLREVHLVLARGAHNQFADLAVAARAEMLTMQWILAQPEMREFLGGPTMVPYEEPWMDRVDAMKALQSWSDASVTHFFELAVHGEQIVLSIRHGRWNESGRSRDDAANWALEFRNEIQRYIHAYRSVTGVDLAAGVDATMPSALLARRLRRQRERA